MLLILHRCYLHLLSCLLSSHLGPTLRHALLRLLLCPPVFAFFGFTYHLFALLLAMPPLGGCTLMMFTSHTYCSYDRIGRPLQCFKLRVLQVTYVLRTSRLSATVLYQLQATNDDESPSESLIGYDHSWGRRYIIVVPGRSDQSPALTDQFRRAL